MNEIICPNCGEILEVFDIGDNNCSGCDCILHIGHEASEDGESIFELQYVTCPAEEEA